MRLRIVGGELSGRRFSGPSTEETRPTSERVREAIAGALQARGAIREARVLELFAGTGALSFEALSRGAKEAVLVERDRRAIAAIKKSAHVLGLRGRIRLVIEELGAPRALSPLIEDARARGPFDLVFADPPYAERSLLSSVLNDPRFVPLLSDWAMLALEHPRGEAPELGPALEPIKTYHYGDTAVTLAQKLPEEEIPEEGGEEEA